MNPNPYRETHVLSIDGTSAFPDVQKVVETSELYRLKRSRAALVLDEVRDAVSRWRELGHRLGIAPTELTRMASVFH